MINIVCLKWGSKYTSDDVNKLHYMVSNSLTMDFNFYCITEDKSGLNKEVNVLPLFDLDLEGWWHKLTLFRPELYGLTGTVLFLDLDVVITGNLDALITYKPGQVLACKDYGRCKWGNINSSVVRFEVGQLAYVWEGFLFNKGWILENMHGDQDWLGRVAPSIEHFPEEWVLSFKKHCKSEIKNFWRVGHKLIEMGMIKPWGEAKLPEETKIVLFHGKPDPIDVAYESYKKWRKAPWILDYWPKS